MGNQDHQKEKKKVVVPKPIILPSIRKEHNGFDPSKLNQLIGIQKLSAASTNAASASTNARMGEINGGDDCASRDAQRANAGANAGWGTIVNADVGSSSHASAVDAIDDTNSSSSNFVKIIEKPIVNNATNNQWGQAATQNNNTQNNVVNVHEYDVEQLENHVNNNKRMSSLVAAKGTVVGNYEERVEQREFPSLHDANDMSKEEEKRRLVIDKRVNEEYDLRRFENSGDDRGRYVNNERQSSYTNNNSYREQQQQQQQQQGGNWYRESRGGKGNNNYNNNNERDALAFLINENSSRGNLTIMKRTTTTTAQEEKEDYVDEARVQFEHEIERVAKELEMKKITSSSDAQNKDMSELNNSGTFNTHANTTEPSGVSGGGGGLRMLVGVSKKQESIDAQMANEKREHALMEIMFPQQQHQNANLTTQELIELQLLQQQQQQQQQQQKKSTDRKKRGGRRVREAEERRILKQSMGQSDGGSPEHDINSTSYSNYQTQLLVPREGLNPGDFKVLAKPPPPSNNNNTNAVSLDAEKIMRQKPSSSLSTSHRLLRRQQQYEQQQQLTEKLEHEILDTSIDHNKYNNININIEVEEHEQQQRQSGEQIGMVRSASAGAHLSGNSSGAHTVATHSKRIEPLRIASPVLSSVNNAFGVWGSSSANNGNTNNGIVDVDTLPDDLDDLHTTTTMGGGNSHTWIGQNHQSVHSYNRSRSVPPILAGDIANALPDDLDDEFGSSNSLYDNNNYNHQLMNTRAPSFVPGRRGGDGYHQPQPGTIHQQYQMYARAAAASGAMYYYDEQQYIDTQREFAELYGMSDVDFLYHAMQEQAFISGQQQQHNQQQHQHNQYHHQNSRLQSLRNREYQQLQQQLQQQQQQQLNQIKPSGHKTSRERRRAARLANGVSKIDPLAPVLSEEEMAANIAKSESARRELRHRRNLRERGTRGSRGGGRRSRADDGIQDEHELQQYNEGQPAPLMPTSSYAQSPLGVVGGGIPYHPNNYE